jgi:UDP-N-acetyl-D-glucosamine dehydrogenase
MAVRTVPVESGWSPSATALMDKLRTKEAHCGVIGLGYVGLPLAVELANVGFRVTGFDVQDSKVGEVNSGNSYIQDVPASMLAPLVESGKLRATTDFSEVASLDTINICVPTPLRKTKDPDMSYIVSACEQIGKYIRRGTLVILESTTYPGTTDELVRPMLERDDLRVGEDIFLCFSPERVDPGNPKFHTKNIPKVVGGCTPACTGLAM